MQDRSTKWDVIVVGAGPAGSWSARGFAKAGLRTALLEEHAEVGTPVHCTGVVGSEIFDHFPKIRSCIWKPVDKFKVFSPEGDSFFLPNVKAFVLNRRKLDLLASDDARGEGAELLLNHKVTSVTQHQDHVEVAVSVLDETITYETKLVVLATGSKSHLPKRSTLAEPPQFIRGVQVEVEVENLSNVELYLGQDIAPGSFAWAVPTYGNAAKTGLITLGNARIHLDKLFESPFLKGRVKQLLGKPLVSRIPMGPSPVSTGHRTLAVGDAAGQVKTTTGGGIYYGLLGAEAAVATALKGYRNGDFVPSHLTEYHHLWRKRLGLELQAGLYFRRIFEKVEDADINRLIRTLKKRELQDLLGKYANFDRHRDLIFALSKVPDVRAIMVELLKRSFAFRFPTSTAAGA